jgi:hypothetical protein
LEGKRRNPRNRFLPFTDCDRSRAGRPEPALARVHGWPSNIPVERCPAQDVEWHANRPAIEG